MHLDRMTAVRRINDKKLKGLSRVVGDCRSLGERILEALDREFFEADHGIVFNAPILAPCLKVSLPRSLPWRLVACTI